MARETIFEGEYIIRATGETVHIQAVFGDTVHGRFHGKSFRSTLPAILKMRSMGGWRMVGHSRFVGRA